VRTLSLENHPAFAAMRTGNGNVDQMICLLRVVYLAWFLSDATPGGTDLEAFREAERVLEHCAVRAEHRHGWTLPQEDHGILEQILALHDQQLASIPSHR
jgi:hypothetical protein